MGTSNLLLFIATTLAVSINAIQDGSANLYLSPGGYYVAEVSVGTPFQNFKVAVDVNSGDLWVPDSLCSCTWKCKIPFMCKNLCNSECCEQKLTSKSSLSSNHQLSEKSAEEYFGLLSKNPKHFEILDQNEPHSLGNPDICGSIKKFWHQKSTSFKLNTGKYFSKFKLQYSKNQTAEGKMGTDVLFANGFNLTTVEFGLIDHFPEFIEWENFEGFFGLGRTTLNANESPMRLALRHKVFDEPMVSLFISPSLPKSKDDPAGSITFGSVDHKNCGLVSQVLPTVYSFMWTFSIDSVTVNQMTWGQKAVAGLDLNLDYIGIPEKFADKILNIPGSTYDKYKNRYYIPCMTQFTFSVTIGRNIYPIDASKLMISKDGGDRCELAVAPYEDKDKYITYLLGRPFFKQYCIVLDYHNNVGIAPIS